MTMALKKLQDASQLAKHFKDASLQTLWTATRLKTTKLCLLDHRWNVESTLFVCLWS